MAQVKGVPLYGVYKSLESYVILMFPIVNVLEMWNVYVVVAVSIDRYIHICMPLKAKSMDTRKYAKIAVIGTFFFSLISIMPKICRRYAEWVWNEKEEVYEAWIMTRQYGKTSTYFVWFYVYVMLVIHLIPLFGILIPVNVAVLRGWRRMRQEQGTIKSTKNKEARKNGTKLTIAMANIFILLRLPACITMLLTQLEGMGFITTYEIDDFSRWTNFLSKLNSTVNFFIYVSVGKSFRNTFMDMCRHCFGGAPLRHK
ncbi:FMRFamide receptor-like [Lineus longissimus]|uniref:FMRFamide receptor-like n=1 Tax=Lineus longissimus TaxID=88925 RepID=UPI00315DAE6C